MVDPSLPRTLLEDVAGLDRHVLAPLREAGYIYLDQIKDLSLEKLFTLVTGPRSQEKLARALDRVTEYESLTGKGEIEVAGKGKVARGEIRQQMSLVGTARYFLGADASPNDLRDALSAGTITEEQIADYILGRKEGRKALAGSERKSRYANLPSTAALDVPDLDVRIDDLVKQYAADYDTRRWLKSDWDNVRRLAMWELWVEQNQRLLLTRDAAATFQYAPQLKALADQVKDGLSTIARMRDEMQVSLKARAERDRTTEAHEVITQFALDAKRLIAERASVLIHCGIRLGICLPHFPKDLEVSGVVRQRCPKCNQWIEWQLVTPLMLQTYMEAGDFVPKDAPKGIFEAGDEKKGYSD